MPGAWLLHTTADAFECFKSNKTLATSDAVSQLALLALAACESLRRPSTARAERIALWHKTGFTRFAQESN